MQHDQSSFVRFITIIGGCLLATLIHDVRLKADDQPVAIATALSGHVHPSICRTKDGTLIVVYKGANVLMRSRSADGGMTWEKPEVIVTSAKRPDVIREVKVFEVYPGTADVLPDDRVLVTWNYIADDKAKDGYYERVAVHDQHGSGPNLERSSFDRTGRWQASGRGSAQRVAVERRPVAVAAASGAASVVRSEDGRGDCVSSDGSRQQAALVSTDRPHAERDAARDGAGDVAVQRSRTQLDDG